MISAFRFEADGSLRQGGRELAEQALPGGASIWIDVEGRHDGDGELLLSWGFHPFAIEDTFTEQHQPRVEEYGNHTFVIIRGIDFNASDPAAGTLETLKLAAFLDGKRLVTLHRAPLRSVEHVRQKLVEKQCAWPGGVVALFWAVADELVDRYFPVIDGIGDEIEALEEAVVERPSQQQLQEILSLRRRLSTLRRSMLPHRQVFNHLANARTPYIDANASLEFRDVYDNVLRLGDAIDQLRDQLGNLKDTYLSVVSQRTNEIMRVLTVFSTILMPLTFIVGVYGMNFENIPELHVHYGYFVVWGAMVAIAGGMLLWFRRKGWL